MHGPACCTLLRNTCLTSILYYLTNMDVIELALKELRLLNNLNISAIIKLYNIDRFILSRRYYKVMNL